MITLEQFYRLANSFPAHPAHPASTRQPGVSVNGEPGTSLPRRAGSNQTDRDFILARARAYLNTVPGAVSGQNGHSVTFRVACKLIQGFDLSPADAFGLLSEWNERCVPPWTPGDLHHKVDSAAAEPGVRGYLLDVGGSSEGGSGSGESGGEHRPDTSGVIGKKSASTEAATPSPGADASAPPPSPYEPIHLASPPRSYRCPEITIGSRKTASITVVEQSLLELGKLPLFLRENMIAHIVRDSKPPKWMSRPDRAPVISITPNSVLNVTLQSWIAYMEEQESSDGSGETRRKPLKSLPMWLVPAVADWPDKSRFVRPLEAVTTSPVFRADGEIIQTAGYDVDSGVLYEPDRAYPVVPSSPTRADAMAALSELLEPACDVTFEKPCHQSAFVALILTMVSRLAVPGCVPMFSVDANQPRVGKGLTIDLACIIANGREPARTSLPLEEPEIEKRLLAIAIAGDPIVLFDNITRRIGGPSLEMAMTARSIKSRILNVSKNAEMPLNAVFLATGNNLSFTDDFAPRTVPIRLDYAQANPESRSSFRHPNLRQYAHENHPRLLTAALTILRAFHVAGRPAQQLDRYGSFEEWSDLVRSAVVWVGMVDPCEGRKALFDSGDAVREAWMEIMEILPEFCSTHERGVRTRDLLEAVQQRVKEDNMRVEDSARRMLDALVTVTNSKSPFTISTRSVAHAFKRRRRVVLNGKMLDSYEARDGYAFWMVLETSLNESDIKESPESSLSHPLSHDAETLHTKDLRQLNDSNDSVSHSTRGKNPETTVQTLYDNGAHTGTESSESSESSDPESIWGNN